MLDIFLLLEAEHMHKCGILIQVNRMPRDLLLFKQTLYVVLLMLQNKVYLRLLKKYLKVFQLIDILITKANSAPNPLIPSISQKRKKLPDRFWKPCYHLKYGLG